MVCWRATTLRMQVVYSILGCPGGMDCLGFENAILKRPADLYVIVLCLPINIDHYTAQVLQPFSQGSFISGKRDRAAGGTAPCSKQRLSARQGQPHKILARITYHMSKDSAHGRQCCSQTFAAARHAKRWISWQRSRLDYSNLQVSPWRFLCR